MGMPAVPGGQRGVLAHLLVPGAGLGLVAAVVFLSPPPLSKVLKALAGSRQEGWLVGGFCFSTSPFSSFSCPCRLSCPVLSGPLLLQGFSASQICASVQEPRIDAVWALTR